VIKNTNKAFKQGIKLLTVTMFELLMTGHGEFVEAGRGSGHKLCTGLKKIPVRCHVLPPFYPSNRVILTEKRTA